MIAISTTSLSVVLTAQAFTWSIQIIVTWGNRNSLVIPTIYAWIQITGTVSINLALSIAHISVDLSFLRIFSNSFVGSISSTNSAILMQVNAQYPNVYIDNNIFEYYTNVQNLVHISASALNFTENTFTSITTTGIVALLNANGGNISWNYFAGVVAPSNVLLLYSISLADLFPVRKLWSS